MGFMGSVLGVGDGSANSGLNFRATGAPLENVVTGDQVNNAYGQAQSGLSQQQAFVNALQAQGAQGMGTQSALTGMLMNQANGQGPNPAQAQLAQATGANTANQAALMAGQRGSSANVGLMARQAAQQGAANQQNSAGQAATLQAQQSNAARQQLEGLAGTQIGQHAGALQGYNQMAQNEQQNLLNGVAQYNNAQVGMQSNMNQVNGMINNTLAGKQADFGYGAIKQAGTAAAMASGGVVKKMADGGMAGPQSRAGQILGGSLPSNTPSNRQDTGITMTGAMSGGPETKDAGEAGNAFGNALGKGAGKAFSSSPDAPASGPSPFDGQTSSKASDTGIAQIDKNSSSLADISAPPAFARGGKVPAILSPGEIYLSPQQAKKVAEGKADPMREGERIKGKAKVPGDDLRNDTVPKKLDDGGVVVPRTKAQDKQSAAKFVQSVLGGSLRKR